MASPSPITPSPNQSSVMSTRPGRRPASACRDIGRDLTLGGQPRGGFARGLAAGVVPDPYPVLDDAARLELADVRVLTAVGELGADGLGLGARLERADLDREAGL